MSVRFGVDPSTLRVAIAVIDTETQKPLSVTTRSFEQLGPGKSAHRLLRATVACQEEGTRLVKAYGRPDLIVFERPFGSRGGGRSVSVQSHYIIAAILIGLVSSCGPLVRVEDIAPNSWKAKCGVGGRAEKHDIMQWACNRWPVTNQDEADSLGIAVAALSI